MQGGARGKWKVENFTKPPVVRCRGRRPRRPVTRPRFVPGMIQWRWLPICHCEEAAGRRGALSAKREEVPLGCNLAGPGRIVGKLSAKS